MNRITFGKHKDLVKIPNLLESPIISFEKFINHGIEEVLEGTFPVTDYNDKYEIRYVKSWIEEPKMTIEEAVQKEATYSARLNGRFQLVKKESKEVIEQDLFLTEIPYMDESGKFIVRGIGRIIVAQIIKSPGVYFLYELDANRKTKQLKLKIQPKKGTWISFEYDGKGILHTKIDNNYKVLSTIFLKAVGVGNKEEILDLFDDNESLKKTFEKDNAETIEKSIIEVYKKIRPGDSPSLEKAKSYIETMFVDPKKYDLSPVGRRKLNQKLRLEERVLGKKLSRGVESYSEGTVLTKDIIKNIKSNTIYIFDKDGKENKIISNGSPNTSILTKQDMVSALNYFFTLQEGIGTEDDIDHLSNRRIRLVGETLQNKFQDGMNFVERRLREKLNIIQDEKDVTIQSLFNVRPLSSSFNELMGTSQLSQIVDQINPLAEVSHKRRISAIGPGGVQKERAGIDIRDVHYSHYGKEDPISTPEGNNVGLILQLSLFARVNDFGLLETPYIKVENERLTDEVVYMTADQDENCFIAKTNEFDENGKIREKLVTVRHGKEYPTVGAHEVEYADVSVKQFTSAEAGLIPFLENDDANRAAMGTNMQRQAIPLIKPQEPIVGTGIEEIIARDTGSSYVAEDDGEIVSFTPKELTVRYIHGGEKRYKLNRFHRSDNNMCFHHNVRVCVGDKIKKGDILADSTSSKNGELALGTNLVVAMMPWEGYNYEDAILLSERVVKEDLLTHVDISEYDMDVRNTRMGEEVVTNDVPNVKAKYLEKLDENGIIKIGSKVTDLDVLVGKKTPKAQESVSGERKLINSIFGEKQKKYKNNSLKLTHGKSGIVTKVIVNTNKNTKLADNVLSQIKVQVSDVRKIIVGDKLAGRHGNKGVVSKILREEDMPYLEDGTPVDILLNPLGVPSRMNIGQILEAHLGIAGLKAGVKFETPVLDGATGEDIKNKLEESGMPSTGKFYLRDGRTGEKFENPVMVGVMYILKLNHQAKEKAHARSTGTYSMVTQQPLGGKSQMGGQRLGEMEVWALEAYGAAYTLQEMLTVKSDDFMGRTKLFNSITKATEYPEPGLTETTKVLLSEFRSLCLNPKLMTKNGKDLLKVYKKERPELIKIDKNKVVDVEMEDETESEE